MTKVLISLSLFVWAFYSYGADCRSVETKISEKSKLYKELTAQSSDFVNEHFERVGVLEQVYMTARCSDKVVVRYKTAGASLRTGKKAKHAFYCLAQLSLKNQILYASCRAPNSDRANPGTPDVGPSAFPYNDANDPFANNNGGGAGPSIGEDPDYPSRNDDGPDSTNGGI